MRDKLAELGFTLDPTGYFWVKNSRDYKITVLFNNYGDMLDFKWFAWSPIDKQWILIRAWTLDEFKPEYLDELVWYVKTPEENNASK